MFGFEFLNYGTQILHNKDLEDMRDAILSDDQEIGCTVSEFRREREHHEFGHNEGPEQI